VIDLFPSFSANGKLVKSVFESLGFDFPPVLSSVSV
jgi:hypothetical protein